MPSMIAVGMSTAFDLPARTHIVDQGTEGIEAELRGVAVGPALGVDPLRRIADGGMRQAHAPVEPRPAAQASDDRNGNRAYDGRTGHGTRVPEVQNRCAGILQSLCLLHQLFGGKLLAMELGKDRDARANDRFHHAGIAQDLHHVRPSLFCEARRQEDRRVPPEIHADGIAHRYQIHSGAVRDSRHLGVPGDHADDLPAVALHLLKRRNRHFLHGLHISRLPVETPASRRIAEMIAPGSARFFPAMSSALPCATDENSTGVPMVSAAVPAKACVFAMMCPWSWTMTTKAS